MVVLHPLPLKGIRPSAPGWREGERNYSRLTIPSSITIRRWLNIYKSYKIFAFSEARIEGVACWAHPSGDGAEFSFLLSFLPSCFILFPHFFFFYAKFSSLPFFMFFFNQYAVFSFYVLPYLLSLLITIFKHFYNLRLLLLPLTTTVTALVLISSITLVH